MFFNLFKPKKTKCLLITSPLIDTDSIYSAMPILTGQLIKNDFNAKNLDLNIKFFNTVFTKEYIIKTKNLLEERNIPYDKTEYEYIENNIQNIVTQFKKTLQENGDYKKSEGIISPIMNFISLPYKDFHLNLRMFQFCFPSCETYEDIKNMTCNTTTNIFIDFFEREAEKIKEQNIDFIGISVPFIGSLIPALTLGRILKKKTNAYIAIGGNFIKEEDIIHHPDFFDIFCDCVLIGEGEESIVQLVNSIKNKKEPVNVNGIIYKNKKDKIICNEAQMVKSLDNIANMSYEGLNLDEYMVERPNIDIMVSKGCYWGKCEFCCLAPKFMKYRIKPPQKVVAELKELFDKHKQIGYIRFQDDALSPAYLEKLADEIIKADLHFNYFIFARLEKAFTKELFEKLYKSGLRNIFWGLESGSQSMLNKMNKGINIENVLPVLKSAHETGILGLAGIIVNFPTETIEEYKETLLFLKKIKQYVDIAPGNFVVMRNSLIEKHCEKYNIEIKAHKEFCYDSIWKDLNINDEERQERWDKFVQYIQNDDYNIDINKDFIKKD